MKSLAAEKSWPWVASAASVIGWLAADTPYPQGADNLFGASATVASVLASFLGVTKAIILSYRGVPVYKVLEKAKYADVLYGYLLSGIMSSIVFATLSIFGFFIGEHASASGYRIYPIFSCMWVAAGALAIFTYLRITNILFKLLKQPID